VLGTKFDGVAWYRKKFRVPDYGSESRVLLRFHGAATQARVWVNGVEVGTHTGPWTPFTFDVTQTVEISEPAVVVVRLDEKVGHSTQGFLPIIAPHFGGLWQEVEVFPVKAAWLDDNRIAIDSTEIDIENGTGICRAVPPRRRSPQRHITEHNMRDRAFGRYWSSA
jgi:beta-galactosidase